MGYNSMFLSNNLGTLNLAYFFYLGGIMVMYYYSTRKDKSKAAKRFYKKLHAMLVYNYIISTVMESYANIAVCTFISLYTSGLALGVRPFKRFTLLPFAFSS